MNDESIPSGALKVAREAFEARGEHSKRLLWKRGGSAFAEDIPESDYVDAGVQHEWMLWLESWKAALASPAPQATGALSEPWAWHVEYPAGAASYVHVKACELDALDLKRKYPDVIITPLYPLAAFSSAKREAEPDLTAAYMAGFERGRSMERGPLTEEHANNVWRRWVAAGHVRCDWLSLLRVTEAAHGIVAPTLQASEDKK